VSPSTDPATWVAGLALAALIAYAVLGGADFGGGIWDLLARGPRRQAQREAIAQAMGPVWEANHVWLIFVIVLLFTSFPLAFQALSIALYVPFHLVLLGITLRGAAFVFRAYAPRTGEVRRTAMERRWGAVFGASSAVTPPLLGMCLGAISSGGLRLDPATLQPVGGAAAWLAPLPLAMGALALALCAYLAAVYLANETRDALRDDFRRRALGAGTAVVALSVLTLPLLHLRAPHLWEGLTGRALPVLLAGGAAALASGWTLLRRHYRVARALAVVQVAMLLGGWAFAQYPYILYPDLTLAAAAAPAATQRFVLYTTPPGLALLIPSLWYLFRVFKREPLALRDE
jgi:cytochrome d ubiquinol oxidase subunit II